MICNYISSICGKVVNFLRNLQESSNLLLDKDDSEIEEDFLSLGVCMAGMEFTVFQINS